MRYDLCAFASFEPDITWDVVVCDVHFCYRNPGGSLVKCDGLYMLGPGSSAIRRCGLVGVGVSLWLWTLRPSSYLPGGQYSASSLQIKM